MDRARGLDRWARAAAPWRAGGSPCVHLSASLDGLNNDGVAGEDLIHDDVENLRGGPGPDRLIGDGAANRIIGDAGADVLEGQGGADDLRGLEGEDEISGGDGPDELSGGASNDRLFGDGDRDTLAGGAGDDDLHGGDSHDLLDGGLGADLIAGDEGNRDKVTYEDRTSRVVVTLRSGANDGEVGEGDQVFDTVEWVFGGSGDDEIVSASRGPSAGILADNAFFGNGGDDLLKGGGGQDRLEGGAGPDELVGGSGDDFVLKGQGGNDRMLPRTGS